MNRFVCTGFVLSLLVYACGDNKEPAPSGGAGEAGAANSETGGNGSSTGGSGESDAGANSFTGGSAGDSSGGTSKGGTGGKSGAGGKGGVSGGGGASSRGGAAGKGGSGGTTTGKGGTTAEFDELTADGPSTDQAPLVVEPTRLVDSAAFNYPKLLLANDGSFVVFSTGILEKYLLDDLSLVWSLRLTTVIPSANITTVNLTPDGEILLGGSTGVALEGETHAGLSDGVVAKLDSDGALLWAHQFGSSGAESVLSVVPGPDGSLLGAGSSTGQLPGHPAATARGGFVVRYDADGSQAYLAQYALSVLPGPVTSLHSNAAGELLVQVGPTSGNVFQKINGDGSLGDAYAEPGQLSAQLDTDWSLVYGFEYSPFTGFVPVRKVELGGAVQWRLSFPASEGIIDEVEEVIWTGAFYPSQGRLFLTSDALYVIGRYQNTYKNGSILRPTTIPLAVARFDLDGKQEWFQEYRLGQGALNTDPRDPESVLSVAQDDDGNLRLVVQGVGPIKPPNGAVRAQRAAYFFTVDKTDGSILE